MNFGNEARGAHKIFFWKVFSSYDKIFLQISTIHGILRLLRPTFKNKFENLEQVQGAITSILWVGLN